MTISFPQRWVISEGETEHFYADFTPILASGETLASVDSVEEEDTDDLGTITGSVNAATYADPHRKDSAGDPVTVAIGKAATFSISGQSAEVGRYTLTVTVTTSAGRVLVRRIVFDVH